MKPGNQVTPSKKQQALALLQSNRLHESKELYRQITQEDRRDLEAWHMLSAVHGMLGELQESEKCSRKVIELDPGMVGAYINLGNALMAQGKTQEALPCYRRVLQMKPDEPQAHNNLGNLLKAQGKLAEAEASYREALRYAPNYPDACTNLGSVLQEQGRLEEALGYYQQAITLQPDHAEGLYNLGCGYMMQRNLAAAATCYERLVTVQPDNAKAWSMLGATYGQLHQHDKAIAACQEAIARQPDMESAHYLLATLGHETVPGQTPAGYVTELFDTYAAGFDQHLVQELGYRVPEFLNETIRGILGDSKKTLDVLDLGCGTGLCGTFFRDIARSLTGVDLSPKMIEKTRQRALYDELIVGDIMLPLERPGAAYDFIIATDVFVYVGDFSRVVDACSRILRPGGLLAFSTETIKDVAPYTLRTTGRYAHTTDYVYALAKHAALDVVSTQQVNLRHEAGIPVEGNIYVFRKA